MNRSDTPEVLTRYYFVSEITFNIGAVVTRIAFVLCIRAKASHLIACPEMDGRFARPAITSQLGDNL